jgi:hypothetical protein
MTDHEKEIRAALEAGPFLICDLRPDWNWRPYVTFWRPNNANYAYPLAWAGDYTEADVMAAGHYHTTFEGDLLIRFPVLRSLIEAIAIDPKPGVIDGNVGPVIRNTIPLRRKLREIAYAPALDAVRHARALIQETKP